MKPYQILISVACSLFLLVSCSDDPELTTPTNEVESPQLTAQEQQMIQDLDAMLAPLQGASPELPQDELNVFDFLGAAKIVGMGEATHGTREFFEMKHRLFQYLVEKHGFRGLAFEFDFAQGLILNEMILTGEGDVHAYVRNMETILYWPWNTQEVSDLFTWMQDYNRGKPDSEKLQVVGIDCQIEFVARQLLPQKLSIYDPAFAKEIADLLANARSDRYEGLNLEAMQNERAKILSNFRLVQQKVQERADAITAATSPNEYRLIYRLTEFLFQVEEVNYTSKWNLNEGSITRDRNMAKNTEWIFEHLGQVKIAIWAHNGHVANDNFYANYGPGSIGYFLKGTFKEDYQIVGFTFAKGQFNAMQASGADRLGVITLKELPVAQSINYYFHLAKADNFMIRLQDLKNSPAWSEWLQREQMLSYVGAVHSQRFWENPWRKRIDRLYDVLIHFDNSSPTQLLSN